jgi:histone-lysine N-methyltransferase MLL3
MVQLRQLSPVGIVEPDLGHNYNICPVIGSGDFSKLNNKGYDYRFGELNGAFANYSLKSTSDYYNAKPFGKVSPLPIDKPVPSHRGFYNQEFAAPRTSQIGSKPQTQSRTPTPLRETDTPDTIVSSSSPECNMRESPDLFPCKSLKLNMICRAIFLYNTLFCFRFKTRRNRRRQKATSSRFSYNSNSLSNPYSTLVGYKIG